MKRWCALLAALMLLPACVLAKEALVLPGFGAATGLAPSRAFEAKNGEYVEQYENVRYGHYRAFVKRLEQDEWQDTREPQAASSYLGIGRGAIVGKEDMTFWFRYSPKNQRIEIRYPLHLTVETAAAFRRGENACGDCNGTQLCMDCDGGVCSRCMATEASCFSCMGSGVCRSCHGTGGTMHDTGHRRSRTNPDVNKDGTIWIECLTCRGSGECNPCRAAGRLQCYRCNESRVCQTCGGSAVCPQCD